MDEGVSSNEIEIQPTTTDTDLSSKNDNDSFSPTSVDDAHSAFPMPVTTNELKNVSKQYKKSSYSDFYIFYPCVLNTKAYRSSKDGSRFINTLCAIFRQYAHTRDLLTLSTWVSHYNFQILSLDQS